jgi:hypothetical protein
MVNPWRPPLPPNRPYHWPLKYLEYVKDLNPNVHVKVFKATISKNGETKMQKLSICLVLLSKILCPIGVTITWEIT